MVSVLGPEEWNISPGIPGLSGSSWCLDSRSLALIWRWCSGSPSNSQKQVARKSLLVKGQKYDNLGPPPLRDDALHLWGLPHLSKVDANKVQQGNLLLHITCHFIKYCQAHSICWVLENPYSSRAWLTEPVRDLQQRGHLFEVHYCQYRQPWKRPTGLLSGPSAWLQPLAGTCAARQGRCSASGRKHILLIGTDANGKFMTLRAQPYPAALCQAIAASLLSAVPVTG